MIIKVLIVGAIVLSALLKRIAKPAPEQAEQMSEDGSEPDVTKRLFEVMRQSMEQDRCEEEMESGDSPTRSAQRPTQRAAKVTVARGGAPTNAKRSDSRVQQSAKTQRLSQIEQGEIGAESEGDFLDDFDLKKAVVYHEILTPKFEEK